LVELLELWKRIESGPTSSEMEFTLLLSKELAKLQKEYEIRYDPENLVPLDKNLAQNIFDAAVKLLSDVGILYVTSGNIIKFSEAEIFESLKNSVNRLFIGEGRESVELVTRKVGDKRRPLIGGGPCACPVSEELYTQTLYSYAKENVDLVADGFVKSFNGLPANKGSPLEMAAVRLEAALSREAIRRAGRPGLCLLGPMSGISAVALSEADFEGGIRHSDIHDVAPLNELKIDLDVFNRLMHNQQHGNIFEVAQCPLHGLLGGAEATAIVSSAEILADLLLGGTITGTSPSSVKFSTGTSRETLWVAGMAAASIKGVAQPIINSWIWAGAGPCTEMLCYEIAALTVLETLSGFDMIISAGGTKGGLPDHYTGMEARVASEVSRAACKLSLNDAQKVTKDILALYEKMLIEKRIPEGKSFTECYSLNSATPSQEYLGIWHKAKTKLGEVGLKFE